MKVGTMLRGIHLVICLGFIAAQADAAMTASDILTESQIRGGLVVVVGCEDLDLLIALGEQQGYLVHGLDTHIDRIDAATAALRAEGLCGRVSMARFDGRSLQFVRRKGQSLRCL